METKNKKTDKKLPKADKEFDAVQYMRTQRDKISKDLADLSAQEIIQHFKEIERSSNVKPRA
jgi:hypothetical protein